jgi:hypothetical protein
MSKPVVIFDTEVFRDYFLASFLDHATGAVLEIETHPDQPLDVDALKAAMRGKTLVGFNSANFDLPVLAVALATGDTERIHKAAQAIIGRGYKGWQFEQAWGIRLPRVDHIDLIEVAPGIAGLKTYGGRLHCRRLQDLPHDPQASISPADRARLREYCRNDLGLTDTLYRRLLPQIELRERMSAEYDLDLRSKSDAQIAEAVLAHQVTLLTGKPIVRQAIEPGTSYHYRAPRWVQFRSLELVDKLAAIEAADFVVQDSGGVAEPEALAGQEVTIGAGVYRLGIGGLHSSETAQAVEADEEHVLVDRDVASYYPSIILRLGLAPRAMGPAFLTAYKTIVERRLAAKAAGDKVTADALKITINGSFGKLGSKWSKLYSPDLLIQTTVTGQLALLMLIEDLEAEGIRVVSANTDGIVIRAHRGDLGVMGETIRRWEKRTGFETEESPYRAIYSRDVNNYIALKPDGGVKLKGAYAQESLAKNPTNAVAIEAAVRWLRDGTPVDETIRACTDVRKLVTVRTVKGGAVDQGGQYLGKTVRWYYARGVEGSLFYRLNGYTVPRSKGARPLMELPVDVPADVDHDWYEREALQILADVGAAGALI